MSKKLTTRIYFFLYNTLWLFLSLPLFALLLCRYRKHKHDRVQCWERLSIYRTAPPECALWLHLASVGEVLTCIPLLKSLVSTQQDTKIMVTTTTPTGASVLRQHLGEAVYHRYFYHCYLPFDFIFFIRRFVNKVKPKTVLLFETEVWPSLIHACYNHNNHRNKQPNPVNILLINARLSEKSKKNYQHCSTFAKDIFSKLTFVAAQSNADADRLRSLGASKIQVTGSIKLDVSLSSEIITAADHLRSSWLDTASAQRPCRKALIAASTHNGEESLILNAYSQLKHSHPELLLVLVPRHAERFRDVEQLCSDAGFTLIKRSQNDRPTPETDIILGDTMGELLLLFGACDVAIMGGTFIERGGHNFLEPAIWGVPIVSGTSYFNFSDIAQDLIRAGALTTVDGSEALSSSLASLLTDKTLQQKQGAAAKDYVQHQQGALKELMRLISPFLNAG